MNIRKAATPASFIRKATESFDDLLGRSQVVVATSTLTYGKGMVAKASAGTLGSRTDKDGNIAPYELDDPEVLGKLFAVHGAV